MMSQDIPSPRDMCDKYCPKHPMFRCGGVFNHRGYHQCSQCELDGIRTGHTEDKAPRMRYFEYR